MCKGSVVGGGAAHKRTWQSSVAAVQRGKGAVRNEAESGRSPAVALLKKQPHKQVTHTTGEVSNGSCAVAAQGQGCLGLFGIGRTASQMRQPT